MTRNDKFPWNPQRLPGESPFVNGQLVSVADAAKAFKLTPNTFQTWVLERVKKRGMDPGDAIAYYCLVFLKERQTLRCDYWFNGERVTIQHIYDRLCRTAAKVGISKATHPLLASRSGFQRLLRKEQLAGVDPKDSLEQIKEKSHQTILRVCEDILRRKKAHKG